MAEITVVIYKRVLKVSKEFNIRYDRYRYLNLQVDFSCCIKNVWFLIFSLERKKHFF